MVIQNYMKNLENIGHISAQECIFPKNYDYDFYHNITGIEKICEKFPH